MSCHYSSFFGVGKRSVQTSPEKYRSLYIFETTLENLNKLVIKHIYNEKVSTTLTEMRA